MKKIILSMIVALSIVLMSCGGGSKDSKTTDQKNAAPEKPKVKKELIVTLTIGAEEMKFTKASILNNAMNPGEKSDSYTIYGTPEGGDATTLNIEFTAAEPGEATKSYISITKYKIEKASTSVQIEEIKTFKGTYGAIEISSLKGSFKGQLKMTDDNGFPTGELIDFNGAFVK